VKREHYKFIEGTQEWRVTSLGAAVTYDTEVYDPAVVKRTEVESKNEMNKANIEITFDIDNTMARRWMTDRVEAVVTMTLFEIDEDDTVNVGYKGRLSSVKPGISDITLTFESIFTSLRRPGLRARFARFCRHSLYGRGCFLDPSGFAIPGSATAATGSVVTVAAAAGYDDGNFTTGILKFNGIERFITAHAGDQVTLIRPIEGLITALGGGAQDVVLYPGCDRTRVRCNDFFNNLPNYGGFDWIPQRNPIDGSSIV
jgi:uncharacterized phage protein (TIGR02218 family)